MDHAIGPNPGVWTDDGIGIDDGAIAHARPGTDRDERANRHALANRRIGRQGARRIDARRRRRCRNEQTDRLREREDGSLLRIAARVPSVGNSWPTITADAPVEVSAF